MMPGFLTLVFVVLGITLGVPIVAGLWVGGGRIADKIGQRNFKRGRRHDDE